MKIIEINRDGCGLDIVLFGRIEIYTIKWGKRHNFKIFHEDGDWMIDLGQYSLSIDRVRHDDWTS